MWLLIDDMRELRCEVTARTPEAAKAVLPAYDWECVCIDHDLGPDMETGYDVMKWAMLEKGIGPKQVQIVSANPVGKKNIADLLISCGYHTKDGSNYFKTNAEKEERTG